MESVWTKLRQEAWLIWIKLGIFCWFWYYIPSYRFPFFAMACFISYVQWYDVVVLKTSWALLVIHQFWHYFPQIDIWDRIACKSINAKLTSCVLERHAGNCLLHFISLVNISKQKFSSVESTIWMVLLSHCHLEFLYFFSGSSETFFSFQQRSV